jgi:hypothetical protein
LDAEKKYNLLDRMQRLEDRAEYPLSLELQYDEETIDNMMFEIMARAEKRYRKLRKGQVAFSPAIQAASRTIAMYLLLKSKLRG